MKKQKYLDIETLKLGGVADFILFFFFYSITQWVTEYGVSRQPSETKKTK